MRLIDADALIEKCKDIVLTYPDGSEYRHRCVDPSVIREQPAIDPEPQWIPCGERLPGTNGVYNVTRKISDGFECRNISDSCYYDGAYTWHDDTRVNHERRYLPDVIAWMPLPKPYQEGADE